MSKIVKVYLVLLVASLAVVGVFYVLEIWPREEVIEATKKWLALWSVLCIASLMVSGVVKARSAGEQEPPKKPR